jgi:hypothetical protein
VAQRRGRKLLVGRNTEEAMIRRGGDQRGESEIDQNVEIVEMEKCDFDDVEGIESDVE